MTATWTALADALTEVLHPAAPPIAITFSAAPPAGVPMFDAPMPPPAPDGRTGRVSAGCVFWMESVGRTFGTVPADHGNCSVGMLTHGLATMDDVAGNDDVAALLECGWVGAEDVAGLPAVAGPVGAVTYGPLAATPVEPDVVLLRLSARSVMVLSDAVPELRVEGKPQCHIVALAHEHGEVAASVGCMLSRVRTGMPHTEMTVAVPARRLAEVVDRLEAAAAVDGAVARYAADDARRFAPAPPG